MPSHASRDEGDQQDGNVLAGAPLDFSEPMRTDQYKNDEKAFVPEAQEMFQEVPPAPCSFFWSNACPLCCGKSRSSRRRGR